MPIASALGLLAVVALEEGDPNRASVLWAATQAAAKDFGIRFDEYTDRRWHGRLGALSPEELAAGAAGARMTADEAASYALSLD